MEDNTCHSLEKQGCLRESDLLLGTTVLHENREDLLSRKITSLLYSSERRSVSARLISQEVLTWKTRYSSQQPLI